MITPNLIKSYSGRFGACKSIIDEKYGSNVNVSLVVDTEVEKIEDKKEEKVNEDDIVSLFDGKDML